MIDKSQADELKRRIQALCDNSVSYRPKYYQAACDYIDSLTQPPCPASHVCDCQEAGQQCAKQHTLYTNADADRPDVICDANGSVTLGLCKVCGKGEAQLSEPCTQQPAELTVDELIAVARKSKLQDQLWLNDSEELDAAVDYGRAVIAAHKAKGGKV